MEFKRLYKYDKDSIRYIPLSGFLSFLILNPIVPALVLLIGIGCIGWKAVGHEASMREAICDRDCEISSLKAVIELEEEYDTLLIRIAEASLEGKKKIHFTDEDVYEYIKSCKAWYPDILMAQYKIESASGKSDIAVNAHNFFGMRPVAGKRLNYTTQRKGDSYRGYAVYDNWKMSVLDKILWDHFVFGGVKPDRKTYIARHGWYAEADGYTELIDRTAMKYRK